MSRSVVIISSVLLFTAIAILYFGAPASETWPVKCPLFQLTGWQCPLCGSQRAIHEVLHGNLVAAWHYNPALWLIMPYLLVILISPCFRHLRSSRLYRWCCKDQTIFSVISLLAAWGIMRNII